MLRSIDDYQVEILLTLALVTGGYALATKLHLSGPLAMVAAGLLIGNHGRRFAMSDSTREHLDTFWKLVDEMLNAVLFVMIGLEVLVLSFDARLLTAGLLTIPVVLAVRFASVGLGRAAAATAQDLQPPRRQDHGLGRDPGWDLGGAGALPARGSRADGDPGGHLHGGGLLDPGPGSERRSPGEEALPRPGELPATRLARQRTRSGTLRGP